MICFLLEPSQLRIPTPHHECQCSRYHNGHVDNDDVDIGFGLGLGVG